MRSKQHRGLTLDRRTQAMGAVAIAGVAGAAAAELARVWRRGSAPLPTETDDLLEAASTATLETIAVVREGYRATSTRENAVFNLLVAFTVTFGITRGTTALIRSGKGHGVLRDFVIADRRVHHFVPGIVLALAAGGTSISVRRKALDRWLAAPVRRRLRADPRRGGAAARARRRLLDREGRAVAAGVLRRDLAARRGRPGRARAASRRELGRHHATASAVMPATTTAAPASRRRPAGSPRTRAA